MMTEMALWSLWWVWLAAALVLAILEVLAPGFIFLGFAIGAALVGLMLLTPFSPGLPALLAAFAVLSLVAWGALRTLFRREDGEARRFDHDIND